MKISINTAVIAPIPPSIAIGDSPSDLGVFSLAGMKIVINPKGGIESEADYIVENDVSTAILGRLPGRFIVIEGIVDDFIYSSLIVKNDATSTIGGVIIGNKIVGDRDSISTAISAVYSGSSPPISSRVIRKNIMGNIN